MKKILVLIMIGFYSMSHSQGLLTNLRACYPMDCDNAVNSATTGASLNGTVHQVTCVTGHSGAAFSAYRFAGTTQSYIELPNSPLLKPQALAVSGWYNAYDLSTSQYLVFTKNQCGMNFEAYYLAISITNNVPRFVAGKCGSSCTPVVVTDNTTIQLNAWYHIVFYVDNNIVKLSVGGNATSVANNNPLVYDASKTVILGGTNEATNLPFKGSIDDVRFYDRDLSILEIEDLFANNPGCGAVGNGTTTTGGGSSCCLGNYCTNSPNPLSGDYSIPLNTHNFNFLDDADYKNKVNIGFNCGQFDRGKFNVKTNALSFNPGTSGPQECTGISSLAENNSTTQGIWNIGTRTEAKTTNRNTWPIGLYATASGPGLAYGVYSELIGPSIADGNQIGGYFSVVKDNTWRNIGVMGTALGANTNMTGSGRFNIGVTGYATDVTTNMNPAWHNPGIYPQSNIGVYGCAGNLNFYSTPSNYYAGWFDGDVMINGTGYTSSFAIFASDKKFKENIQGIEKAMDLISQLNPTTYSLKTKNEFGMNFSEKKQYGFISQEVEKVFPDLVTDVHKPSSVDNDGKEVSQAVDYKGLNYMGFIAILTKGLQEQQQQINELKTLVNSLAGTSEKRTGNASSSNITLTDKNAIVLNQNVPNPFAENTVITYNIPDDFTKAEIVFTTNDGVIIKSITITEKGQGSINVFANDLSHGVYTYTLVVDGKSIDSKKMIKN